MEHYVGTIYNFVPTPQRESIVIDIPFYEQDREILSDEILINIEKANVKQQVIDRYNKLYEIEPELIEIIKKKRNKCEWANEYLPCFATRYKYTKLSQYIMVSNANLG